MSHTESHSSNITVVQRVTPALRLHGARTAPSVPKEYLFTLADYPKEFLRGLSAGQGKLVS